MSSGFDWRTEENEGWDEQTPAATSASGKVPRPKPRQLIIGFVIVAAILIVIIVLAKDRVKTNTERLKTDVMATHELFVESVFDRDADLFSSMLSGEALSWRQLQLDLLRHRLVLARLPLGFSGPLLSSPTDEISPTQVILSPQLDKAEVRDIQLFEVLMSNGITSTVELEQTFHYQLNGTSWLLTGVDDKNEYWGSWHRVTGELLTLVYPNRDADLGARLALDLDILLSSICNEPDMACPRDFQLIVRFNLSEGSLLRLQEGVFDNPILAGYGPATIDLPAPSIVGLPVDELGYTALYQGYASWLAAIMLTNYEANGGVTDETMMNERLSEWGLMPMSPPELPLPFRARIPFPPGVVSPEHNIMMLCSDSAQMRLVEYQMADGNWINRSSRTFTDLTYLFYEYPTHELSRLANYDGVLYFLQEPTPNGSIWRAYLWQDGSERMLTENEQPFGIWPPFVQPQTNSPEDSFIMYQIYPNDVGKSPDLWILALADCFEESCQFEKLSRIPIYSPSGNRTLLVEPVPDNQLLLHRGDREGQPVNFLGRGHSPTWISDDTFAYILEDQTPDDMDRASESGAVLVKGTVVSDQAEDDDNIELLLTSDELRLAIPEPDRPDQISITSATTGDNIPGRWYLIANKLMENSVDAAYLYDNNESSAYLFRYDEVDDAIDLIQAFPGQAFDYSSPMGLVGQHYGFLIYDGRILRYMSLDTTDDSIGEYGQAQPYDQSADGAWLLFSDNGVLRIASPKFDFEWTLSHELQSCHAAVWVDSD